MYIYERALLFFFSSMLARIGSLVAPFVVGLDEVYKGSPFLIFGVSSILATLTSVLLPETRNEKLPSSLSEAENIKTMR